MHSGQSAYNDRLQQRHPLMRIRSDLRAETIAAACEEILGRSGARRRWRAREISVSALVSLVHDLHHDYSYNSRRDDGPSGARGS